jgi:hypothetical protein
LSVIFQARNLYDRHHGLCHSCGNFSIKCVMAIANDCNDRLESLIGYICRKLEREITLVSFSSSTSSYAERRYRELVDVTQGYLIRCFALGLQFRAYKTKHTKR